jgi:hypothetical protein
VGVILIDKLAASHTARDISSGSARTMFEAAPTQTGNALQRRMRSFITVLDHLDRSRAFTTVDGNFPTLAGISTRGDDPAMRIYLGGNSGR